MKTYYIKNCTDVSRDFTKGRSEIIVRGDDDLIVSDGYHTVDELYEHRITLWIAYCKLWEATRSQSKWQTAEGRKFYVWRSKLHADGSSYDGWFILGMTMEDGKQLSYHLPMSKWDETDFATNLDKAPEWDGHSPQDVLERLKNL